jgi:hypothetical protein
LVRIGWARLVREMQMNPGEGATMDIGGWLRELGFSRYETTFKENAIDAG